MPHWLIFHPPGTFEDDDSKRAITKSITEQYTRPGVDMTPSWVVVNFIKTQPEDQWLGGEKAIEHSDRPFIRIQVQHIHIRLPEDPQIYEKIMGLLKEKLKPHTLDKGYDYELNITEAERLLWTMNGLAPPPKGSEDEKVWRAENRVVYPEEMEAMRRKHHL